MIPATRRTNNVAGYALDVTPWSTASQFWIKMEAYTPVLQDNSIFELYVAIKDKFETDSNQYDTVKCSMEMWNLQQEHAQYDFRVEDFYGGEIFYDSESVGTNVSVHSS